LFPRRSQRSPPAAASSYLFLFLDGAVSRV
jgi:hypothetical protein